MGYNIWIGKYGNRTDKLGKMVCYCPNFPLTTKILQITILDIDDWDRIRVNIQKKIHLYNRIHLYIIKYIHDIININYCKKEREKNFKFPQE